MFGGVVVATAADAASAANFNQQTLFLTTVQHY